MWGTVPWACRRGKEQGHTGQWQGQQGGCHQGQWQGLQEGLGAGSLKISSRSSRWGKEQGHEGQVTRSAVTTATRDKVCSTQRGMVWDVARYGLPGCGTQRVGCSIWSNDCYMQGLLLQYGCCGGAGSSTPHVRP